MSVSLPPASLIHGPVPLLVDAMEEKLRRGPMWLFLNFNYLFKDLSCFASVLPPFPPLSPSPCLSFLITVNGSNSCCMYNETIIYRSMYVQIRILFKRNLVGERELYSCWHLFLYVCLSLLLDRELFEGKDFLGELLRHLLDTHPC